MSDWLETPPPGVTVTPGGAEAAGGGGLLAWLKRNVATGRPTATPIGERLPRVESEGLYAMRGIAIAGVVVAHATTWPIVYLLIFGIPLFFFLSGYLYRPVEDFPGYLLGITKKLLVPYVLFMAVIAAPGLMRTYSEFGLDGVLFEIRWLAIGGEKIGGIWAAYWFPTCFFFTHALYTWCARKFTAMQISVMCIPMLALAALNSHYADFWLPLALNVVPFVFPAMHAGRLYRQREFSPQFDRWFHIAAAMIAVVYLALVPLRITPTLMVKIAEYGWPVITLASALCAVIVSKLICDRLARFRSVRVIWGELGKASMTIMFVHQPVQLSAIWLFDIYSEPFRVVYGLIGSYLLYRLFRLLRWA